MTYDNYTQPSGEVLLTEPTENDLKRVSGADRPNHGLEGTEKQLQIIALATEDGSLSTGEIAERVDSHPTYTAQVLRRADDTMWTELFVPWSDVEHIGDPDKQEDEYIRLLTERFEEILERI